MLRYGILRIGLLALFCTAGFVSLLALLGISEPTPTLIVAYGVLVTGIVTVDLARSGRRVLTDFRKGRYEQARRGTQWLLRWSIRRRSRSTLRLNLAACHLASGDYEAGGAELAAIDHEGLADNVRGIWENNYAYYLLCTKGDALEALRLCDKAATLNPRNPAFRSTRGIAHLALGRIDDAIAELQAAVDAGPESQGLAAMAENYHHLAHAWDLRGERAYARDHYLKSVNIGPDTLYGRRSADKLQEQHGLWPSQR